MNKTIKLLALLVFTGAALNACDGCCPICPTEEPAKKTEDKKTEDTAKKPETAKDEKAK